MNIQRATLPSEIEAAIPKWLPEITEYLELEEAGFGPRDVKYSSYFVVDGRIGFAVFDYAVDASPYARDEGPHFAFLQYSLPRGLNESACIGCWGRASGQTLSSAIAEYFQMNPIRDE